MLPAVTSRELGATQGLPLVLFDPFQKKETDRNYPGLQLEPIGRGLKPVASFFLERVKKDKGARAGKPGLGEGARREAPRARAITNIVRQVRDRRWANLRRASKIPSHKYGYMPNNIVTLMWFAVGFSCSP